MVPKQLLQLQLFRVKNAFNSFKRFNVNSANTVNVIVPNSVDHLINLVHSEKSKLDGTLNFLQNGKVGGNVFFVNPHGITVGAQGVINVGSLTAVTPTQQFMNGFFTAPGKVDINSLDNLVNGKAPLNPSAQFINEGVINSGHKTNIFAGSVVNYGNLYSCAVFDDSDLDNIVNMNTMEKGVNMVNQNGEVSIVATNYVNVMGNIVANQKIPFNVNFESKTGSVNVGANIIGRVNAEANNGNINIIQLNGDLDIYKIKAKNDANIMAFGSLKDANGDFKIDGTEVPNIKAQNINLISVFGDIGSKTDDLNIVTGNSSKGGILNAFAPGGSIYLNQSKNEMGIDFISAKNDVVLISKESITDKSTGENPNVTGHNIVLVSQNGKVGYNYIDQDIDIQSNINSSAGKGIVHAFAGGGDVALQQAKGDVYIERIYANGTAGIKADGSIIGVSSGPDVVAKNVRLTSDNGSIKGSNGNLIVDVDNPSCTGASVLWNGKGQLSASAADEVKITDISDDLYIDYISAGNNIQLIAEGSILNGSQIPQMNSVSGSNIFLKSISGGIGGASYWDSLFVETKGGALTANAVGNINIASYQDLYLDTVETKGNITLDAKSIYSSSPGKVNIKGADINLTAQNTIGTVTNPIIIVSTSGSIYKNAPAVFTYDTILWNPPKPKP